ncbi:DUF2461 domain-containing protein [Salibacteraceae bacterium]|nr:DUF2461 domain-containing protein [Salibacteraceae bacterium]MDB4105084.1 DUF2461 domain-containing protein [Salibacteraceae bacterium]MDB9709167.1 DUF2461 domain-containing protein [Salibacteraceae bacterium]MDC1303901.1 DUF2461 domain-containing protein [Salibacteraceae bacterium]
MAWFTKEYEQFFDELNNNNEREWFNANKSRYEKHVKKPFEAFVSDLILRMQQYDSACQIQPKDAIFRVNRDIRFSKDKTPYKVQMSAVVGKGGKKESSLTGVYLELGSQHLRVYGGVYQSDKEQLRKLRQEILYNTEDFSNVINEKSFKRVFQEIRGEKNKRLDPEFAEILDQQPLIANKQFYYFANLDPDLITSDKLVDEIFKAFEVSLPVRDFLMTPLLD